MQPFSEKVVELWNNWEIRGMVLLSLTLQTILIIFGSRRKCIARTWIRIPIWCAYLLADLVATVALGNLARSQGDWGDTSTKPNNLMQVFWAPFLLLHLGGPDTITAYSVEDNELWLRHLLNLVIQFGVASYVLLRSWANNALMFLSILVFIAGIIKYGERNWVLRSSTSKRIRDSLHSVDFDQGPTDEMRVVPRELNRPAGNYLDEAYYLFKMSKYLFQDLILGLTELKDSYSIISAKQSSEETFKLIEVELGFVYDMLFTKTPIIYSKWGIFLRGISFFCSITALMVFSMVINKQDYAGADIGITYMLLAGAPAFEVYAFLHLFFSDRTMVWFTKFQYPPTKCICDAIYTHHKHLADGRRWSRSMAQHNLISFCFNSNLVKNVNVFGVMDELVTHMFINWKDVNVKLQEMIFKQLLKQGQHIQTNPNDGNLRNQILAERGDAVLKRRNLKQLLWTINGLEFNHSLLIWHIATDLFYYENITDLRGASSSTMEISKCLSDYMCYLLAVRPNMLPKGIGGLGYRYEDTRREIMGSFRDVKRKPTEKQFRGTLLDLLASNRQHSEVEAAESSKSVLFYGAKLATEMLQLETKEKWETISEVWIEMLGYAASRCEWKEHAQQLRRGGELLTHVALLMAHLGLSKQYQEIRHDPIRQQLESAQRREYEPRRRESALEHRPSYRFSFL